MNTLKKYTDSSIQTKIIISVFINFIIGFIIYSFIDNPFNQLVLYSVISFVIGTLNYIYTTKNNEKFIVLVSSLIVRLTWIYIFMKKYRKVREEEKSGKKSYICSSNNVCLKDGTYGPHDGLKKYEFRPPSRPEEKNNKIPAKEFDIRIPDRFTYMFWLNIDYKKWKNKKFYGKDKIILMKGNNDVVTSDLSVWALPIENVIQFNVCSGDNHKPVSLSTKFPFNKWVHYSIVVNGKIVELYKNATLEQSSILRKSMFLKRSPLYIGRTAKEDYSRFPGKMIYLSYNNNNLNPGEIHNIYKSEYSNVSQINDNLKEIKECNFDSCEDNQDFNISKVLEENNENNILYTEHNELDLPSDEINQNGLLNKFTDIVNEIKK